VTLTKDSLAYPREIVDEYVSLGLSTIYLKFLNNLGDARKTWKRIEYTADEYLDFWREAVSYIDGLQKQGKDIEEFMVRTMQTKIGSRYDPNFLELRSPCGASIGQLVYGHEGKVYTCDEGRMVGDDLFMLGDVKVHSMKDLVTGKKACSVLNASINDQYICDNCAYKPYCGLCPVCSYAESGSIITEVSQTNRCRIYMAQFDWVVKEKFIKDVHKSKDRVTYGGTAKA
jgi:radical SAM protein with 4Fe4S-binding SPASM domain